MITLRIDDKSYSISFFRLLLALGVIAYMSVAAFAYIDRQNTGDTSKLPQATAIESESPVNATETSPATQHNVEQEKPFIASVCTKTPIPFKTIYKDAPYLDEGTTHEFGGSDGWVQKCTANSNGFTPDDVTLEPYDKTVYRGTYVKSQTTSSNESSYTPPNTGLTAEQVRQQKIAACIQQVQAVAPNSSAYQQCYYAY